MKTITVNAQFKSIIDWVIHFEKGYNTPLKDYNLTKEIYFDNDTPKETIIKYLQDCISFNIEEDSIEIKVKKSNEELEEIRLDNQYQLEKFLKNLKYKTKLKEEYKEEIYEYLSFKGLDWIIKELDKLD